MTEVLLGWLIGIISAAIIVLAVLYRANSAGKSRRSKRNIGGGWKVYTVNDVRSSWLLK